MTRGHIFGGRIAMAVLIIKEDVCAEAMQECTLVLPCQEQRFIDSDSPTA
jgi:hypothetical protein